MTATRAESSDTHFVFVELRDAGEHGRQSAAGLATSIMSKASVGHDSFEGESLLQRLTFADHLGGLGGRSIADEPAGDGVGSGVQSNHQRRATG